MRTDDNGAKLGVEKALSWEWRVCLRVSRQLSHVMVQPVAWISLPRRRDQRGTGPAEPGSFRRPNMKDVKIIHDNNGCC